MLLIHQREKELYNGVYLGGLCSIHSQTFGLKLIWLFLAPRTTHDTERAKLVNGTNPCAPHRAQ
jgi:hypothetical protein